MSRSLFSRCVFYSFKSISVKPPPLSLVSFVDRSGSPGGSEEGGEAGGGEKDGGGEKEGEQ